MLSAFADSILPKIGPTRVDTGPRFVPNPGIMTPVENTAPTTLVPSPSPTWLADVNAKNRAEQSVNAFLETLDPELKQLIQDDINFVGGISQFLSRQSIRTSFTEADVAQSISEALQASKVAKITDVRDEDYSLVKQAFIQHRTTTSTKTRSNFEASKELQIESLLSAEHLSDVEKVQLLDFIFESSLPSSVDSSVIPKSIHPFIATSSAQRQLRNTCHFKTFLGLFSANETARGRANEAIRTVVPVDDAEKDEKAQAKALLQAILDNDLNAYSIAFHQFKANIQYADVAEGQQSSPSSSIELANRAYQLINGREDDNLFGEIEETNNVGRSQTLNAVIQLDVPTADQSLSDLFAASATTGNGLINRYQQNEGSNHAILSIPRVYITESGRAQKNTSSIDINWDPIQIDGQDYTPVAIGVHYGVSANGGHHESYTRGTPITDAMKKGLEYVVLEKA